MSHCKTSHVLLYHSCSLKNPMCFPFSISGYMPATKKQSLHSTAGSENMFHTVMQFQGQMRDQAQNHIEKNKKTVNTLRPHDSFCLLLISPHFLFPTFKRPIPAQKWIFKQKGPSNIPKAKQKFSCQCTNPIHHLARATPKTTRKPFRGHGQMRRQRPLRPPQRSAARPRRPGVVKPPDTAPSRLGRQGCDADGGAGCLSGWWGKKCVCVCIYIYIYI